MIAKAEVIEEVKNKRLVHVEVKVDDVTVLTGELTCYVLEKHVLSR
jgi:acyl-coenzyme A thioesterase PaaI-like protein